MRRTTGPEGKRRATTARRAVAVVCQPQHLRRTGPIALVVGLVLTAINHGDTILAGDATAGTAVKWL